MVSLKVAEYDEPNNIGRLCLVSTVKFNNTENFTLDSAASVSSFSAHCKHFVSQLASTKIRIWHAKKCQSGLSRRHWENDTKVLHCKELCLMLRQKHWYKQENGWFRYSRSSPIWAGKRASSKRSWPSRYHAGSALWGSCVFVLVSLYTWFHRCCHQSRLKHTGRVANRRRKQIYLCRQAR